MYIGDAEKNKGYLLNPTDDRASANIEGQLRTFWEYHSLDKRERFSFHMTFNLDDLIDDPGDGGGMSYQSLF